MAENSKIEWCDHTFNPWYGCTKVSPGCDHCYAEGWAKRSGLVTWGPGEDRRRTTAAYWRQPLKWNQEAKAAGVRRKVFCASLADVFDNKADPEWRDDLWKLIASTQSLDWLLLTKRPQNILASLPLDWVRPDLDRSPYTNVWLGSTVENQEEADRRIKHLLEVPAAVHFLSCEPLLGPLDITKYLQWSMSIDWLICGGESGPGARPMHPDWARSLRDQCVTAGVYFFFKQWGEWVTEDQSPEDIVLPSSSRLHWAQRNREGELKRGTDKTAVWRTGKKAAGALIDGREWRQFPMMQADAHGE